jgi:hypothetical protein
MDCHRESQIISLVHGLEQNQRQLIEVPEVATEAAQSRVGEKGRRKLEDRK